jgi:ferrous iron transport protein A
MSMNLNHAPMRQWRRIAMHSTHHPRLLELGFLPLENVRVLQRSWFRNGALVVQVGDAVFGLRPDEASQIELQASNEPGAGGALE